MATGLRDLPAVAGRFAGGDLSADQVRVLVRSATPEDERACIGEADRLSVAGLQRLAAARRPIKAAEEQDEFECRWLVFRSDPDGRRMRF